MLRFVGALARVVFGLALASLAAGLVTVLFVDIDMLAGPLDRLPKTVGQTVDLALLAATHIGIFASVFILITAVIGEWLSIRALSFYLFIGVAISLLGLVAQYASEVAGQPTILNNYAIKAFLTIGFFGGFVYWLAAGQFAGRAPEVPLACTDEPAPETAGAQKSETDDNVSVVITHQATADEQRRWRMPKLERLKFSKRGEQAAALGNDTASSSDGDER